MSDAVSRTRVTRLREKVRTKREELDALLDSARVGHFAITADHGPVVLPSAIVRDGDRVLTHGSTGSRWLRALADGAPTCLAVQPSTAWWSPARRSSRPCTTAAPRCSGRACV